MKHTIQWYPSFCSFELNFVPARTVQNKEKEQKQKEGARRSERNKNKPAQTRIHSFTRVFSFFFSRYSPCTREIFLRWRRTHILPHRRMFAKLSASKVHSSRWVSPSARNARIHTYIETPHACNACGRFRKWRHFSGIQRDGVGEGFCSHGYKPGSFGGDDSILVSLCANTS